jgi:imidazolonepropionase-like amidohydrolase
MGRQAVKRVLRWVLGLIVVLAALGFAFYLILQPPAPLPLPEPGAVLNDVTVIEPGQGRIEHQRLVVKGATIEAIEAAQPGGGPYAGTFVLPGLTDMHVHFPPASLPGQTELFAFLFLYHGVTAVRDAGDVDGTASEPARRGISDRRFPGPRVQSCGPFVDAEPLRWKNSLFARNPEEGRRAVQTLAERGYDCVKAYNELDAETLAAIRDEAKARGLPVIGHVPHRVPYEEAKLDDAQHLIGIPPPLADPSIRFPLSLVAFQQLDDARLDFMISESLRSNIASTPTLVTIDRLIHTEDHARMLQEPDLQLLPRFYREVIWSPTGGTSAAAGLRSEDFAMVRDAFARMKRTVRRLHDGGVRIHTGTDTLIAFVVPGASLHRELRILVDAGFTPEEALALSMHDSADFLRVKGLGTLRPGAPADLLVFREDPTQRLDALDSLVAVIRDGRLYSREDLDAQLKRYQDHFNGKLYDAIVTPLVRRALASATSH